MFPDPSKTTHTLERIHRALFWVLCADLAFVLSSPGWHLLTLINVLLAVAVSLTLRRPAFLLWVLPFSLSTASFFVPVDLWRRNEALITLAVLVCNIVPLAFLARALTRELTARGSSPHFLPSARRVVPAPTAARTAGHIILILGVAALAASLFLYIFAAPLDIQSHEQEPWVALHLGGIAGAIEIAAGIGVLRGLSWGLPLYAIGMAVVQVLSWIGVGFGPLSMIPLLVYFLMLGFLTSPSVKRFVALSRGEGEARAEGTERSGTAPTE